MTPLFLSIAHLLHPCDTPIRFQGLLVSSGRTPERPKCSLHSSALRACLDLRQPFPKYADFTAVADCCAGQRQQTYYRSGGRYNSSGINWDQALASISSIPG